MNEPHSGFGRVLFLQGPSSVGKSTLAKALQLGLDEYWWVLEADDITGMQPVSARTGWWNPTGEERPHPSWEPEVRLSRWLAGYFQCIATIARTGSNVIAVGGWLEASWLIDLTHALQGIHALCLGVHAPLDELQRREMARGDRELGYALSHYHRVHSHGPYDLDVDTLAQSTDEIVASIRAVLASSPKPTFFERMLAS
ncbi:hypothetical protein BH11ARM2_BH11ARM2_03730 [soil metagenome]